MGDCYSLKESKYCGAGFGDYQMSSAVLVGSQRVSNSEEFDQAIEDYFGSPSDIDEINFIFNCTGWNAAFQPRYRVTYICRALLQKPQSLVCNNVNPVPEVCETTCNTYAAGWRPMIQNKAMCPNEELSSHALNTFNQTCWIPPFNGVRGSCIDGLLNERDSCGFVPPFESRTICDFCESNQDPCCTSAVSAQSCSMTASSSPARNSTIIISVSVIGGLLLLALLILAVLLYRRKKRRANNVANESLQEFPYSPPPPQQESSEYKALFPYDPQLDDEISLSPGDNIKLIRVFDDGWAIARNFSTGREGAIPLACLTRQDKEEGSDVPRRSSSKKKGHVARSVSRSSQIDSPTIYEDQKPS